MPAAPGAVGWPTVAATAPASVVGAFDVGVTAPAALGVLAVTGTTGVAAACCAAASAAAALGSTAGCVVEAVEEPSCDEVVLP
ncbi:UNVERIFIED_CONTAM: hypothetical protein NY100_24375, partial [Prevotella sp. 15_C9]